MLQEARPVRAVPFGSGTVHWRDGQALHDRRECLRQDEVGLRRQKSCAEVTERQRNGIGQVI
jgi:hypothetical protein